MCIIYLKNNVTTRPVQSTAINAALLPKLPERKKKLHYASITLKSINHIVFFCVCSFFNVCIKYVYPRTTIIIPEVASV